MASLQKKSVAELRTLCEQQGIDYTGLKKAQLIEKLNECNDEMHDSSDHEDKDDHEQVEIDNNELLEPTVADSEAILALKLKIKLAQIESANYEKQLAASKESKADSKPWIIDRGTVANVPKMLNDDAHSFFLNFEKAMTINGINKEHWAQLLPSKLNARAAKVYSRLSVDKCKCYETIKSEVLNAFCLTSRVYM